MFSHLAHIRVTHFHMFNSVLVDLLIKLLISKIHLHVWEAYNRLLLHETFMKRKTIHFSLLKSSYRLKIQTTKIFPSTSVKTEFNPQLPITNRFIFDFWKSKIKCCGHYIASQMLKLSSSDVNAASFYYKLFTLL